MSTLSVRQAEQNLAFPLDDFLYHESVGVVIVAIPKVGCSTIKRWYMRHVGVDLAADPHKYAYEHLALSRRTPCEAARILESRRVIAPVRDPAERLRSAFVDKFVWPKTADLFEPARDIIEDMHRASGVEVVHDAVVHATLGDVQVPIPVSSAVDYSRRPSFHQFVEYVCDAQEDHLDSHWRPQHAFIRDRRVDVLVPIDALSATLAGVSRALGAPVPALEPENVTRKEPAARGLLADVPAGELHERDLFPLLAELTDDALMERIRTRFADDLALLDRAKDRCRSPMSGSRPSHGLITT